MWCFGEQPSAAKWNILGTNDSHFNDFLGANLAWQSWTPTLSGLFDNAKWTKDCKYTQIGKTVHFRISLTASTTTPMSGSGDATFSLPVTSITYPGTATLQPLALMKIFDASAARHVGAVYWKTTTTAILRLFGSAATYVDDIAMTSAIPMTWTTSDEILIQGSYEAA